MKESAEEIRKEEQMVLQSAISTLSFSNWKQSFLILMSGRNRRENSCGRARSQTVEITRSVIVNALRKFESAKTVVEMNSSRYEEHILKW